MRTRLPSAMPALNQCNKSETASKPTNPLTVENKSLSVEVQYCVPSKKKVRI